jgi:hypothetical protein
MRNLITTDAIADLVASLLADHIREIEGGATSYGTAADNADVAEDLKGFVEDLRA